MKSPADPDGDEVAARNTPPPRSDVTTGSTGLVPVGIVTGGAAWVAEAGLTVIVALSRLVAASLRERSGLTWQPAGAGLVIAQVSLTMRSRSAQSPP